MGYLYQLITQKKKDPLSFLLRLLLRGCSFLYYLTIKFALWAYKRGIFSRYRLEPTVISVGNITWGGTGKTPLVEMLAKQLTADARKVAILSRGYKNRQQTTDKRQQMTGVEQRTTAKEMGDEPYLLAKNLPQVPVLVGKDRVATGRKAIEEHGVDTIILDDGFQYWRLRRNLDIVALNSSCPFGNGRVLPAGILREPLSSLRRADIFMLTKTDSGGENLPHLKERLTKVNPQALIVESVHQPLYLYRFDGTRVKLEELSRRNVCLVSSIADPASFEKTVANLGAAIKLKFQFPDHHDYRLEDVKRIDETCRRQNIKAVVTTEKDIVRLSEFKFEISEILVLRIEIKLTRNEREFFTRLYSLFER